MPNLGLVPQSEVLTPIFQVSCPTNNLAHYLWHLDVRKVLCESNVACAGNVCCDNQ